MRASFAERGLSERRRSWRAGNVDALRPPVTVGAVAAAVDCARWGVDADVGVEVGDVLRQRCCWGVGVDTVIAVALSDVASQERPSHAERLILGPRIARTVWMWTFD